MGWTGATIALPDTRRYAPWERLLGCNPKCPSEDDGGGGGVVLSQCWEPAVKASSWVLGGGCGPTDSPTTANGPLAPVLGYCDLLGSYLFSLG